MPLALNAGAGGPAAAYMIPQQYTVRTIAQQRVGTSALMNCMGLVIHSPQYHVGCLAHIEAQGTTALYTTAFQNFVVYMVSKIQKYGGIDGGMQVALFGNSAGPGDQAFTTNIEQTLAAAQIRRGEIIDQRNANGGGPHYFAAGGAGRIGGAGVIGAIAYNPANGSVDYFGAFAAPPAHDGNLAGIRRKQLQ